MRNRVRHHPHHHSAFHCLLLDISLPHVSLQLSIIRYSVALVSKDAQQLLPGRWSTYWAAWLPLEHLALELMIKGKFHIKIKPYIFRSVFLVTWRI